MNALRTVLRLNAASCIGFGLLFAVSPVATATFVGDGPPALFRVLGVGLVINGGLLLHTASAAVPRRLDVTLFAVGDFIWVAATLALAGLGVVITTGPGLVAGIAVAALVGTFGALQLKYRPSPQ